MPRSPYKGEGHIELSRDKAQITFNLNFHLTRLNLKLFLLREDAEFLLESSVRDAIVNVENVALPSMRDESLIRGSLWAGLKGSRLCRKFRLKFWKRPG